MPQVEQLANKGYLALKKETTPGTPVIPTVFAPLYKDTLDPDLNIDEDSPIMGMRSKIYKHFMGMRKHSGVLTTLAEPNTAQYFLDMLLKQGTITGANPYTHPYTEDLPNSYTVDIQKGQVVHRYWGVKSDKIEPSFEKNKMQFNVSVAARGSLLVREIASVSTTTITLKTDYDPAPNKGFVATDLIRILKPSTEATLDTTVTTVNADGITLVLGASAAAFAAGDLIYLRAQTPTYSLLPAFTWGRTEFRFADTAANALTAAQTQIEQGSKWTLMHEFAEKDGAQRSGSFDPASIPHAQTLAQLNVKKFFDFPDDLNNFLKINGGACVIRSFSGSAHELRITLNNIVQAKSKRPLETGKIIYNEMDYNGEYKTADAAAFSATVINAIATA